MNARRWWPIAVLLAALTLGPAADVAQACPSCKTANETDSRRPQAYMYSILFMISMPAIVLTGFSIGFYRMSRRQRTALDARFTDPLGLDDQSNSDR